MATIYIIYYSRSGGTKTLAKRVFDIFREFIPNKLTVEMMDAAEMDYDAIKDAAGYIFGTPDYFGYPSGHIKLFFDNLYGSRSEYADRPVFGIVSSGGGSTEPAKELKSLCKWMGFNVIDPFVTVKAGKINAKHETQIQKNCQKMLEILKLD